MFVHVNLLTNYCQEIYSPICLQCQNTFWLCKQSSITIFASSWFLFYELFFFFPMHFLFSVFFILPRTIIFPFQRVRIVCCLWNSFLLYYDCNFWAFIPPRHTVMKYSSATFIDSFSFFQKLRHSNPADHWTFLGILSYLVYLWCYILSYIFWTIVHCIHWTQSSRLCKVHLLNTDAL